MSDRARRNNWWLLWLLCDISLRGNPYAHRELPLAELVAVRWRAKRPKCDINYLARTVGQHFEDYR